MIEHRVIADDALHVLIKQGKIILGGNKKLKIYGTLHCVSGKRMMKINRVFFEKEEEAILLGFRPCGRCLSQQFKKWKSNGAI